MKTAKMIIDRDYTHASTDEKLFCSFVEPLGRCIYGGLSARRILRTFGRVQALPTQRMG